MGSSFRAGVDCLSDVTELWDIKESCGTGNDNKKKVDARGGQQGVAWLDFQLKQQGCCHVSPRAVSVPSGIVSPEALSLTG